MHIFGESNSQALVPYSYYGQTGWFALPRGYFTKPEGDSLVASPNSDFSQPKYNVRFAPDGTMVIFDMLLARSLGMA